MNKPRCTDTEYTDFLVATPRAVSCVEAARVQPRRAAAPAHDAFTRLLHRLPPDPAALWHEVSPLVDRARGVLIADDSTLDKPYAEKMELVHRHWSGKHHAVVEGINLITLLGTDGDRLIPVDYRVYDKPNDGITKNEHFLAMLLTARERGCSPECVLFDSWYASVDGCPLGGMRLIRDCGWRGLTRLKANRRVSIDYQPKRALESWPIAETGTGVHLEAYGLIRVFRVVATDGDTQDWATDDRAMGELERLNGAGLGDRGLPPGVEAGGRGRTSDGAGGTGATYPYWDGDSGLCAAGMASGTDGDWLGDGTRGNHPPCAALLSRPSVVYPPTNCVSPIPVARLRTLQDDRYSDGEEHEAEVLASLILERVSNAQTDSSISDPYIAGTLRVLDDLEGMTS